MRADARRIVSDGYDAVGRRYLECARDDAAGTRARSLQRLVDLLPAGSDVLDLGCGAGLPVTRALARRHRLTGVDLSAAQLALARRHAPGGRFVHADMAAIELAPASFDAVVALWVLARRP